MNAAELTKSLLKTDAWIKQYKEWHELTLEKKSFERYTAMCIGKAQCWFEGFLQEDSTLQCFSMGWVAGTLIKQLKEHATI